MGVLIKTLFKEANHLTSQSYKSVSTKENIEQNFKNVHKVSYVMYTSCHMCYVPYSHQSWGIYPT